MAVNATGSAMPPQALEGVTVLDLSQRIAGPYCTKLLADYGAEVIKIEPPGTGDPARIMGPFFQNQPHPDKSGLFLHLNINKRSLTLDLRTQDGRAILRSLVREADILVESFAPGFMASLGLGYEALAALRPALVMTSITPFGQTGPYRDWKTEEIVTYAMGGPMYATGMPDREPLKLGGNVLQYHAGAMAAAACMFSYWAAVETGRGDWLDLSLMRIQAANQDRRTTMLVAYQYTGDVNGRRVPGALPATGIRPVADGYLAMTAQIDRFPLVCKMIGRADLLDSPRWGNPSARIAPGSGEEFDEYLLPWMLERTKQQAFMDVQAHHIPCGPLYEASDLLADPHFQQRGVWTAIDHPIAGRVTHPGRPFVMSETPWQVRRPAPQLGQHNQEVLGGMLGLSGEDMARLRRAGVI